MRHLQSCATQYRRFMWDLVTDPSERRAMVRRCLYRPPNSCWPAQLNHTMVLLIRIRAAEPAARRTVR